VSDSDAGQVGMKFASREAISSVDFAPIADGQGGTAARSLPYGVREGGDGDEICMDAEVLFLFLDEQSRSLRDFIRFAREG